MSLRRTYLDHNATTPLRPEGRAAMLAALDLAGNASSVHREGRAARETVESAREQVARLVGVGARDVVFTSGGTEANNAIMAAGWQTIVISKGEHASVGDPARSVAGAGARLIEIPLDSDGLVCRDTLSQALAGCEAEPGRVLVSIHLANNETGVIQPIDDIVAIAHEAGAAVHTDAVQAAGKMRLDLPALGVDYATVSAHKLGGPKGVGAAVTCGGTSLPAFVRGGGQERGHRSGTENIAGIAGFGAAAGAAARDLASFAELAALRDRIEAGAQAVRSQTQVIGAAGPRLVNTSCLALPGNAAETTVIALDLAGIAVSAGAACSSGKVARSHVLEAMGLRPDLVANAIRISLGWTTTGEDVTHFLEAWDTIAADARRAVA